VKVLPLPGFGSGDHRDTTHPRLGIEYGAKARSFGYRFFEETEVHAADDLRVCLRESVEGTVAEADGPLFVTERLVAPLGEDCLDDGFGLGALAL
jgi:hypothetical protein